MLRIAVHTPAERPQVHEFAGSDSTRVGFGRDRENAIVLDYTYISRRHGAFACEDGTWIVVDLGSRSGIALTRNGTTTRIAPGARQILKDGDTLRILHTQMRVQVKPSADQGDPLARNESVSTLTSARRSDTPQIHEAERLGLLLALARDLQSAADLRPILEHIAGAAFGALMDSVPVR